MNQRNATHTNFKEGSVDTRSEAEQEARTLRSLIGDLLKTNQELREALLDAGGGRSEPGGRDTNE